MWKINIRKLNKGLDNMDPHVIAKRNKFRGRRVVKLLVGKQDEK
jgi:hypothetical protein